MSECTVGQATGNIFPHILTVSTEIPQTFAYPEGSFAYNRTNHLPDAIMGKLKRLPNIASELIDRWIEDTAFHSSPTIILQSRHFLQAKEMYAPGLIERLFQILDVHPYHAILGLGELVSPLPFGKELAGDLAGIVSAWKEWGRDGQLRLGSSGMVSKFAVDAVERDEPY